MDELPRTEDTPLRLGPLTLRSRLIVGTGKYPDFETMRRAHEAAGVDCVTVAIRRVDLEAEENLLDYIDRSRIQILPNTAGCFTVEEALRTARLARELLDTTAVKLEVIADPKSLLPDPIGTYEATRALVAEGFHVLPYTSDDPILCRRLADAGATAVMPLGSGIGSGMGILNPHNIAVIRDMVDVPVIVDAGVGTASDVAIAFELGVDGVLLNTGIARAEDPVRMARAMRLAAVAGREAFRAGRIPKRPWAQASSPMEGRIDGS